MGAVILGIAAPASQGTTESLQPSFEAAVEVEWILVPVVVRSASEYLRGLEVDDFELRVDDHPVALDSFENRSDAPVSLVHLQDLSGSMALSGKLASSRRALECFLDQVQPGDEIAMATFASGRIQVEVPFTTELGALREAMASWRGYGTTALHDAVSWLPDISVRERSVKRAALLISDGVDNASVLSSGTARNMVRQAQMPVYVLGLESGSPYELNRRGEKRHRHADGLNLLAHLTGGQYHAIVGQEGLIEACRAIVEDLRAQYVLGFATGAAGISSYRSLHVEVPGKDVTVIHRRGYTGRLPATD
ncbi:MAG: VWA domain-containing protein [Acidobacteriota bacterium]